MFKIMNIGELLLFPMSHLVPLLGRTQYNTIQDVIKNEEGPRRKEKAQHALDSMAEAIKQHLGYDLKPSTF